MLRLFPRGLQPSPNSVELCRSPACTRCRDERDLRGGNRTQADNFTGLIFDASFDCNCDFELGLEETAVERP